MILTLRLLSILCLLLPLSVFSQITILESQSQLTGLCPGQEFNVVIDASGTYNAGNRFIVQMSDSAGNFLPPKILGEIPTDGSNLISFPLRISLPAKNAPGNGYKIRIAATNPQIISNTVPIQFLTVALKTQTTACDEGTLRISPYNGVPPIRYSINFTEPQTDTVFKKVPVGKYLLITTDASGCELRDTFEIKKAVVVDGGFDSGFCSDTMVNMTIFVKYGDPKIQRFCFSYRRSDETKATPNECLQIGERSYRIPKRIKKAAYWIYVRSLDNFDCVDSTYVNPPADANDMPMIQYDLIEVKNVTCAGKKDGRFYIDYLGGANADIYLNDVWYKKGGDTGDTFWVKNLAPGKYTIRIDAGNCPPAFTDSIEITEPQPLESTSVFPEDPTCGKANGKVTLSLMGGTKPYQFRIKDGAWQSSGEFANLKSGIYLFEAKDSAGCIFSFPSAVPLSAVGEVVVDSVVVTPACDNQSNGSIRVYTRKSNDIIEYQLNNEPPNNTGIFTNLINATYQIHIRNTTYGCDTTITKTVLAVEAPRIADVKIENPLCADNPATGRVTVKLVGGVRPVSFALSPLPFQSDSVFNNVRGGIYNLIIKYGNCELPPQEVRLEIPTPVSLDTNVIATSCSTATIQAFASGGKGGFQYRFNNGVWDNQSEWTNLPVGNSYSIIARDANGCETQPITVTLPNTGAVQIIVSEATPNTCFGSKNGKYVLEATGKGTLTLYVNGEVVMSSASPLRFSVDTLSSGTVWVVRVTSDVSCAAELNMPIVIQGPESFYIKAKDSRPRTCTAKGMIEATVIRVGANDSRKFEFKLGDNGTYSATDSTFEDLELGTYRIWARDIQHPECDTFLDVTIKPLFNFSIQAQADKLACVDKANGRIVVTPTNGTAPQYSINGGAFTNNPIFDNLAKGIYTIIGKDGICADTVTVEIKNTPALEWDAPTVTDVRCAGENNGSIIVLIKQGKEPYQYSKDNGNTFQASNTFNQLDAGIYTILIRDANDCDTTRQVEVKQLSKFSITAKVVASTCNGSKILVTPKDADGKVQYSLTENTGYGDLDTLYTTQSGKITVYAKDAVGCIQPAEVNVPSVSPIKVSITVDTIPCFGGNKGIIHIKGTVLGLTTVTLDGPVPVSIPEAIYPLPQGLDMRIGNLTAGKYHLVITDESKCPLDTFLDVLEQPKLEFIPDQIVIQSATCTASDGSVTLAVKGGKGTYQYKLEAGGSYQNNPLFNTLPAGDHVFFVKDENGCEQSTTINVPSNSPLKLGAPTVTWSCAKAPFTGKIEITATGSNNSQLNYRLTAIGVDISNNSGAFENLAPNKTYTVTVTDDATQCTDEVKDILVPQFPSILATITKQDESCNGADGKITVTVTQGQAPYSYKLDNGNFQDGNMFNNLTEGTYTIYIKDANGCDTSYPNNVIAKPTPIAVTTFTKGTDVTCNGKKDGTIRIEITGGIQPYTVNITPLGERTLNSPVTLTDLAAGIYTLTSVKDANGCTWTGTIPAVTITEPNAITFSSTKTDPTCEGKADGSITFQNVAGGTPPYQYSIDGGTNYQATTAFTNLVAKTYYLMVKDAQGCITATQSLTLTASAITIQTIPHLCIIRQSGSGTIDLSGYASPTGGTWSGQFVTANEFKYDTNTPTGDYALKYTFNGCEKTATLSVTRLILPEKDSLCADAETYVLPVMPVAGDWTLPTGFTLVATGNPSVSWNKASLPAKTYTFTYQAGNCQDEFALELHAVPEADFMTNSATNEFVTDDPVILQATLLNGADVPNVSYFWKFGDGATSNEVSPTHRYTQPNNYTIELTVTSIHNCTTTVSKSIKVDDLFRADLPNVITPNGDDINDVFPPKGFFPPNVRVTMTVLDRFGQVTYRYNSESTAPWEAKDVPEGTYFYSVEMRDNQKPDRQPVIRQGQVTVIR